MLNNEFKNFAGPRVLANNERMPDERVDPRIIDTANTILQHSEKMKQNLREKFRKNQIGFKGKLKDIVSPTKIDQKQRNLICLQYYWRAIENYSRFSQQCCFWMRKRSEKQK